MAERLRQANKLNTPPPPAPLPQEYNCAMMACVTGGEPARALDLLEQMKGKKGGVNTGPDIVTYTSAITACGVTGKKAFVLVTDIPNRTQFLFHPPPQTTPIAVSGDGHIETGKRFVRRCRPHASKVGLTKW